MVSSRMPRERWRFLMHAVSLGLASLALAGFILAAAGLPHTHDPGRPGVYNQEHDLGYFATFGGSGLVPAAPSAAPLVILVALAVCAVTVVAPVIGRRHPDFRAPPLR